MAKKSRKRFFMKRVEEQEESVVPQAVAVTEAQPVVLPEVFPQNSRPITAGILSRILVFFSYFGIMFFVGVVVWNIFFPLAPRMQPIISRLTHQPFSATAHLDYLSFLVSSHRLTEATDEARFIAGLQPLFPLSEGNIHRFKSLNSLINEKQTRFKSVVDSYLYWRGILNDYPNYRDALYMDSQYSYMLFDDVSSRERLRMAVALDPQFTAGHEAAAAFDSY